MTLMQQRASLRFLSVATIGTCLAAAASPARAVTLEHKWTAGQQLTYDFALDGTMTIETDASAPVLFAGIPLDVKLTGGADVLVDTREVAEDGGATLALSFPRVTFKGTAWEQVATLDAKEGSVGVTFNGKAMGKDTKVPWLLEPQYAIQVGKNAHVERIVSLKPAVEKPTAETPPAPANGALPINVAGLMRSMALQLLPTLWPGRDIAPGETWSMESRLPVLAKNAAASPALEMLPLGKFELTLGNEEEMNGRQTYRVALQGLLDLDAAKASRLGNGQGTRLSKALQKVAGTLWFDAAAGQLVRADIRLNGNMSGFVATPGKAPGETNVPFKAGQRFDGTLKVNLKSTSMKTAAAPADVVPPAE